MRATTEKEFKWADLTYDNRVEAGTSYIGQRSAAEHARMLWIAATADYATALVCTAG